MPDEKCYACAHVLSAARPVLYACREDGDLILACGGDDHAQSINDWKVVHRGHLLGLDPTLTAIRGLADNEEAARATSNAPWTWGQISD